MVNIETMRRRFAAVFDGRAPKILVRAPGRVNLIGEHTDYNEGFVLPMAIERAVCVAAGPRDDRTLVMHSAAYAQTVAAAVDAEAPPCETRWANYVVGTAAMLRRRGAPIGGAELLIESDLPPGGGLSSSAALEVAAAKALLGLSGASLTATELAALCRRAENEYAQSPCGIMDQYVCLLARRDHALFLDCRSLEFDHVPFQFEDAKLVIVDTGVRHEVASSAYQQRQSLCAQGARYFRAVDRRARTLRDVTDEMLSEHAGSLPQDVADCCRHVVTENRRVLRAREHLGAGAVQPFGQLMYESHRSLRDRYRVCCDELDAVVDIAAGVDGVYGARMTGAGFGGCAIVLVRASAMQRLQDRIRADYERRFRKAADVFASGAVGAAECMEL